MKNFRTRPVDPSEEETYWHRADDCWELAQEAARQERWAGCAINTVHAAIALADLMTIRHAGKRCTGTSHDEAVDFYSRMDLDDSEFQKSVHRLGQIISIKSQAEYSQEPLTENQVRQMLKSAGRFRDFVLKNLKRS